MQNRVVREPSGGWLAEYIMVDDEGNAQQIMQTFEDPYIDICLRAALEMQGPKISMTHRVMNFVLGKYRDCLKRFERGTHTRSLGSDSSKGSNTLGFILQDPAIAAWCLPFEELSLAGVVHILVRKMQ